MYKAPHETYYSIETKGQYLVQTQLQIKSSRVHSAKKMIDTNVLPEKQKPQLQNKQVDENRPRLGKGRVGIRCKKPQPVDGITTSTGKSHKIPMAQNITKNSTDFPVPEQLITDKTEAITRRTIQDKNRELPFYPDLIYRLPPRPPENL